MSLTGDLRMISWLISLKG